jgi:hypothetical protein
MPSLFTLFITLIEMGVLILIQALIWNIHRPKDDLMVLVQLCVGVLILSSAVVLWKWPSLLSVADLAIAQASYLFLSAAYICWYPAAQAASPTMLIVMQIARTGELGCAQETLKSTFSEEQLCNASIEDLFGEGFATEDNGIIHLTPRGKRLLKGIRQLRSWVGLGAPRG